MFHSTFRHVPEAFYRVRTLKGVCGYSLIWVRKWSPRWTNGSRAFHRATMISQDTQINTAGYIFLPRTKLKTLRAYTCTDLHAYAYLPYTYIGTALIVLRRPGSYEVYAQKGMLLVPCIYFQCYRNFEDLSIKHNIDLVSTEYPRPKTVLGLKWWGECLKYWNINRMYFSHLNDC